MIRQFTKNDCPDDSVYRLLGAPLVGLTAGRERVANGDTYGAVVSGRAFTL